MQIDGNKIQQDIKQKLKQRLASQPEKPRLDIIYAGSNSVIETFTQLKRRFGEAVGVAVNTHKYSAEIAQQKLQDVIAKISKQEKTDGVVVQLPLPDDLQTKKVLDQIPARKDVDVLSTSAYEKFKSGNSPILPPVVGAIKEICDRHDLDLSGYEVAVIGQGRLVGQPIIDWLKLQGNSPQVFKKGDDLHGLQTADVIISGAGDPHIIRPEHISGGVVLLDAGTSQSEGGTRGDIDPACADKARLFTSVPGGIGPITVAKLFQNLVVLSAENL